MEFILYSDVDERSISNSLGVPEYSYFFVLKAYRAVLERQASVHLAHSHADVLGHHERLIEQGKSALVLIFAPPNKAPVDLPCPSLCVVAWEYDRIPDETWDDEPRNDWRYVFARHGAAISLSQHTARAIKAAMGEDFPVLVLPTPLWQRFQPERERGAGQAVTAPTVLEIRGCILDSHLLGLSADGLIAHIANEAPAPLPALPEEDYQVCVASEPSAELEATAEATQAEPNAVDDLPALTLKRRWVISKHYLLLWYREALADLVPLRARQVVAYLRKTWRPQPIAAQVLAPEFEAAVEAVESTLEAAIAEPAPLPFPNTDEVVSTEVMGVVYVSVFNPQDGRKNWEGLVTAFCWAFKEVEDATLILKITHRDLPIYYGHMLTLLSQLSPFKCRVLVMHGFLEDEQFSRLYSVASYYVNHSLCEGLCLPLMEFMSCGKPALTPDHTAMADYIDKQVAFITPSGLTHTVWGHDPRLLYRSLRYRPDWGALMQSYKDSYQVAKEQPQRYGQMSAAALARMQKYAGEERFWSQLEAFAHRRISAYGGDAGDLSTGSASC
jgi:glycosyltransferase involved in cell wall biosynthesis